MEAGHADVRPPEFVRWVDPGEDHAELLNEAKANTWVFGVEHAMLRLSTGELVMVRGGRDAIEFEVRAGDGSPTIHLTIGDREARVVRIEWHTHPRATGPSDSDRAFLAILGQDESLIFEIESGDETRFGPKPRTEF